jgi:hypothetical protein
MKDEKHLPSSSVIASVSDDVVFVNRRDDVGALGDRLKELEKAEFIAVVSTFGVHLGDQSAATAEADVLGWMKGSSTRVVVFRSGHLLGAQTRASLWLRRFGFAYPLVPGRLRSCFVVDAELLAAIERERSAPTSRRTVTVLGPSRAWRDVLGEHRTKSILSVCLTGICYLLALTLIGHVAAQMLDLLARWRPSLRCWNFDTLRPRSFDELLALCNPHNFRHVKVVGYNNGVVHFGHRYPGKTVVSTVLCDRVVRTSRDVIKADCGATIRKAMDFLAADAQEFYVLPNYSYVCLGTAFFVPIHGSAADYTTIAETIVKALLYDPVSDRFILAASDEPAFREHVYNAASNLLVLRLWIRVKPKARYYAHQEELENASSEQLLHALRDTMAANVEIRKSKASSSKIQVTKYYKAMTETTTTVLEVPRDSIGRLWDRLEENAITSFLMHALTRWLAWHVELFFTADEFATFWKTHQSLPLKKIQLRYIRRDGLPHSPFGEHDCVSVDLFMFRWSKERFEAYLKQTFAVIRSNPGKHSE